MKLINITDSNISELIMMLNKLSKENLYLFKHAAYLKAPSSSHVGVM